MSHHINFVAQSAGWFRLASVVVFLLSSGLFAAERKASVTPASGIPAYYSSVNGKSGATLFSALTTVTNTGYSKISYDGLIEAYKTTDVYPKDSVGKAGKLWDMYGGCEFSTGNGQKCGNYSGECDCYNREHSIPKSWWGSNKNEMYSDIFHLIPTDGYVNNIRGNYEFGVVKGTPEYKYNGCKKGVAGNWSTGAKTIASAAGESVSGSGTVFEPQNQFKGDLARGYLGMIMKWNKTYTITTGNSMFQSSYTASSYYGLTKKAVVLLMKWHREDPVSQKEIDRNNGIQATQGNRNPFIDYPYLAEYIWGEHAGETVDMSKLMCSQDKDFVPGKSNGWRGTAEPPVPALACASTTLSFSIQPLNGSNSRQISITGKNLTGDITLSVSGTGAAQFYVSPSKVAAASANGTNKVTVTYAPFVYGRHTALLTISSAGASSITVNLTGECGDEFDIRWWVDGEEYYKGAPTQTVADGGRVSVLPTAPAPCSENGETFAGWTTQWLPEQTTVRPADLFSSAQNAPLVTADANYNAVFMLTDKQGTTRYSTLCTQKIEAPETPELLCTATSLSFPVMQKYGSSSKQLSLTGSHLTDGITLSLSGAGKAQFYVSPSKVNAANANGTHTVTVSYSPYANGMHTALLTISSEGAEPLTVSLTGECADQYDIRWWVNGEEHYDGDPTQTVINGGRVSVLPVAPAPCPENGETFAGWSEQWLPEQTPLRPNDLFTSAQDAPLVNKDANYNAVFTEKNGQGTDLYSTLCGEKHTATDLPVDVTSDAAARKVLINGRLYILVNGKKYNVTGSPAE